MGIVKRPAAFLLMAVVLATVACASAQERERLERTIDAEYDEDTGRLELLTHDSNDNGTVDVWTYMDGTRILRAEVDANEDGLIERWEYYDESQQLEKVGFSRANDGVEDGWAYEGPDGSIARVELSTLRDGTIDRWEYYDADGGLATIESEPDPNGSYTKRLDIQR